VSIKETLLKKINQREIVVGVVGLGYVGLPLAVEKAKAGYKTIGFDIQDRKVEMLNQGINYIGDVVDSELKELVEKGMLSATKDFSFIKDVDFIAIAVPTPLDAYQQPDISYVRDSTIAVAKYLRRGSMVVLESTTYPGTTEELILPLLEQGFFETVQDFPRSFDGVFRHPVVDHHRGFDHGGVETILPGLPG
jgi:UDP-N-acetyl-D-glucosamine dehydrogenase